MTHDGNTGAALFGCQVVVPTELEWRWLVKLAGGDEEDPDVVVEGDSRLYLNPARPDSVLERLRNAL